MPVKIWRGPANRYRDGLEAAGLGDGTAQSWVDLRPLIAYGVPYEIRAQGRDVQTGEWFTLNDSPRRVTCLPL